MSVVRLVYVERQSTLHCVTAAVKVWGTSKCKTRFDKSFYANTESTLNAGSEIGTFLSILLDYY